MERHWIALALASIVFVLIVLIYTRICPNPPKPMALVPTNPTPLVGTANTWQEMSEDDKLNYLVSRYLDYDVKDEVSQKVQSENALIAALPQDGNCKDNYDGCPGWAANGECDINPEFMLYNCKSSCKSCALNDQQLEDVTHIMNTRSPPSCVYHGAPYPGPFRYTFHLLEYKQ
jgi:hypothetical protein